jgi:hypothetical protein
MSLSTRLAGDFSKNVRKRSEEYYYKGRVMNRVNARLGR